MTNSQKLDFSTYLIFGVTLFAVMGVSLIAPSLVYMQQDLHLTKTQISLVVSLFTLPGLLLAPVIGVLADKYGRKQLVVPSLFLFGVSGGLIAFTTNFTLILILRFIQGTTSSGLTTLAITMIGDKYKGLDRTRVIGLNASILSVGTASYPFLGGILTDLINWQAPFYIFTLAIPYSFLAQQVLQAPNPSSKQETNHTYFKQALKDISDKTVLLSITLAILAFIMIYGALLTYLGLYLGEVFHASSTLIGLVFTTSSITTGLTASQVQWFDKKFSTPAIYTIGLTSFAISVFLTTKMHTPPAFFIVSLFFVFSVGITLPIAQTRVISSAPKERRAIVSSFYASATRGGQTLGPITFTILFQSTKTYTAMYMATFFVLLVITIPLFLYAIKHPLKT